MRFLIDAQLPYRLKHWLADKGNDCLHTLDLPEKNNTADSRIIAIAVSEDRILVSKDRDFLNIKILHNRPKRLLLITTGNVDNDKLLDIFKANFEAITKLFETYELVELGNSFVVGKSV